MIHYMKVKEDEILRKGESNVDIPKTHGFTKVPMRAEQVPLAVDAIEDDFGTWSLADMLCGTQRNHSIMGTIRVMNIDLV